MTAKLPIIAKPFETRFHILSGNYKQLIDFLKYLEESEDSISIWANNKADFFSACDEVTRCFFNFAVGVTAYVDSIEKSFKSLPQINELSTLLTEYQKETRNRFTKNENHSLICGLRHYSVHIDTTSVGGVFSWSGQTGENRMIVIPTGQIFRAMALNKGHGFNREAQRRIKRVGENLYLRHEVEECYLNIKSFRQWLWDQQAKLINSRKFIIVV